MKSYAMIVNLFSHAISDLRGLRFAFLPLLLVGLPFYSFTQETFVSEEWIAKTGSQNFNHKSITFTDGSLNVYVAGATLNGNGNYDILATKYDPNGNQLWQQLFAGAGGGDDVATALTINTANGDVFITGTVYTSSTDSNDVVVLKYNSTGNPS